MKANLNDNKTIIEGIDFLCQYNVVTDIDLVEFEETWWVKDEEGNHKYLPISVNETEKTIGLKLNENFNNF